MSTPRGFTATAYTLLWAQIAFVTWSCAHGFFFNDDYVIQGMAASAPWADPGYLLQPWGGHLMPAAFLLAQLPAKTANFNYGFYVVAVSVMQAAIAWGLYAVLVRLFGHRWRILLPLTFYLFSIPVLQATTWWASAINALPYLGAILAATFFTVSYVRTRLPSRLALALGSFLVGLLFFEKAILLAGFLALLTIALSPERSPWRAVGWAARRAWPLWVGLLLILSAWGLAYASNRTSDLASHPDPGVIGAELISGLGGTWLVSLAGGPWQWIPVTPGYGLGFTPFAITVLAILLAIVVAVWLGRSGTRARRLLVALGAYGLAVLVLINMGRQGFLVITAALPRYYADLTLVAVLCLALILMRLRDDPWPEGIVEPELPSLDRPGNVLLALGALNALIASYLVGALALTGYLGDNPTRGYTTRAIAALQRMGPSGQILDDQVPASMAMALVPEQATRSLIFSPLADGPHFGQIAESAWTFNEQGDLVLGEVRGPTSPRGPVSACGWSVTSAGMDIPLDASLVPWRHVVRIQYLAPASMMGSVRLDDGPARDVIFNPGLHDLLLWVDGGGDHVRVDLRSSLGPLCIDRVTVGAVVDPARAPTP